jgi:glycosyltransferase involved in cell wall biosynthesis
MRILYHHRIASSDGQAVHVEEIVHALRAAGHEVLLVGPASLEREPLGFEGGITKQLKRRLPRALYELAELAYNAVALVRLWLAVRRFRPDIIYERYNLYFIAGVVLKRILRLPLLLEVNAPLFAERSRYGGIAIPALGRRCERVAWRGADLVLVVTRVLGDVVRAEGVAAERIVVIPNGINPAHFDHLRDTRSAHAMLGLPQRTVLGFTGFMREWHGLERLVELVAASPDRCLLLVGDGPARPLIERRADELGVADRVRITGVVGRNQVAAHVIAFDVALQPDVVDYASPLKLFEYLALGRAIVAPDKPNIREILEHERNALLFPAGDTAAMALAVERMCRDPALRERLGSAARATIAARDLTWAANARRIVELAGQQLQRRSQRERPLRDTS